MICTFCENQSTAYTPVGRACTNCAIEYYTGLVQLGAASFRAGQYVTPPEITTRFVEDPFIKTCRTCSRSYTSSKLRSTLCPPCLSSLRSQTSRRAVITRRMRERQSEEFQRSTTCIV